MTDILRVLLIEDSETDAKLILRELERIGRPVEFERVETAEAMGAALERSPWDIILSDWSMPSFTAPGALSVLTAKHLDLPFIIVSGTIGEEVAVESMRAGAHDFVLKGKLARLTPAVERELREAKERTARRQAEAALKESEGRFRRLAESGIIGIVVSDLQGNILDANETYSRMVGYSCAELVQGAVRWADLIPAEFAQIATHALEQLQTSGVAAPWETECLRKDGSRVPVLIGAAMLEYPRCIAFAADLTERRRAEAGRLRAEEALRQSEEQLKQAQKLEAVGRLAGGVAHDFNNILSVILTYGELIIRDLKANDPLRADMAEIQKAASRGAGLTRQLLMFSRQQVVEPKVLDLEDVLVGMDRMLERILGEDIDLVLLSAEAAGRIKVDPSHVEQVILNLVVNARDAMPIGGKLTIETCNVVLDESSAINHLPTKPGPYVMLAVTDTGVGMDRETRARIFEPFFTTKGIGKGTGLGLSTVFGIVRQCGGSIWVDSEVGKGATFKVYFPRVDAEVDALEEDAPPTTLRGTETILLVEDEEQVRGIVLKILSRQGYTVISARSGSEALVLGESHPTAIDLLITDVVMPQMSGPELAKRLLETRPAMRTLCMSGHTDDSIVSHGALDDGFAFLQKPITPTGLALKVREVLDKGCAKVPSISMPGGP